MIIALKPRLASRFIAVLLACALTGEQLPAGAAGPAITGVPSLPTKTSPFKAEALSTVLVTMRSHHRVAQLLKRFGLANDSMTRRPAAALTLLAISLALSPNYQAGQAFFAEPVPAVQQKDVGPPMYLPAVQLSEEQRVAMLQRIALDFQDQSNPRKSEFVYEAPVPQTLLPSAFPEHIQLTIESAKPLNSLQLQLRSEKVGERVLNVALAGGEARFGTTGFLANSLSLITTVRAVSLPNGGQRLTLHLPAAAYAYLGSTMRLERNWIRVIAKTPVRISGQTVVAAHPEEASEIVEPTAVTLRRASAGERFDSTIVEFPLTAELLQQDKDGSSAQQLEIEIAMDSNEVELQMFLPDGKVHRYRGIVHRNGAIEFEAIPTSQPRDYWKRNIFVDIVAYSGMRPASSQFSVMLAPQHVEVGSRLRVVGSKPVKAAVVTQKVSALKPTPERRPEREAMSFVLASLFAVGLGMPWIIRLSCASAASLEFTMRRMGEMDRLHTPDPRVLRAA
jgi:hypothetical protein